eukprot:4773710-Amphidinium_carterae.1
MEVAAWGSAQGSRGAESRSASGRSHLGAWEVICEGCRATRIHHISAVEAQRGPSCRWSLVCAPCLAACTATFTETAKSDDPVD